MEFILPLPQTRTCIISELTLHILNVLFKDGVNFTAILILSSETQKTEAHFLAWNLLLRTLEIILPQVVTL
jgi:hypothetical protein